MSWASAVYSFSAALQNNQCPGPIGGTYQGAIAKELAPLVLDGTPAIAYITGQPGKGSLKTLTVRVNNSGEAARKIEELLRACHDGRLHTEEFENGGLTTIVVRE